LSADVDDIIAAIVQNNPKAKFFFDNYTARQVGRLALAKLESKI
jgi:hypothetical protein